MDSMEKSLKEIRVKNGIINYDAQSKVVTREYFKTMKDEKKAHVFREVKNMFSNLQEKGGEFIALNENLNRTRGVYNDLKLNYEASLKDMTKELTYSNVVTRAHPAEKKSYPIRWLIVLIALCSAVFTSVIVLLGIEIFNKKKFSTV